MRYKNEVLGKLSNILFAIYLLIPTVLFAQLTPMERKVLKTANSLFDKEQFSEALPLYLKIDSVEDDAQVKYRIGACYLNTKYEKLKALPYLEEVSQLPSIQVPVIVYNDLGKLYHYTYRFDDAIEMFEKYMEKSKTDEFAESKDYEFAKRMISVCLNAIEITTQPFKADIDILGAPINTMESEFCPMITADEQMMVYMQALGLGKIEKPIITLMVSARQPDGNWGNPVKLEIESIEKYKNNDILLAGLSPDGQSIFLNIGEGLNQDIYMGSIASNTIIGIKKLNKNINTPFYEGRASISADGTELYFVSDRPGGFGGTDIYKSKRSRKGDWDEPINIGAAVNTIYNEDSPFMHPDNVTLFFSSEGHKSIGGNDIFKSKVSDGVWSEPENLGFPNSTKDDLYFVLNANGQTGYFSSSKNNIYNKHKIYRVSLKDPIPLTLVKGVIKAGTPALPIAADIKVYDKQTGVRVKYVYNPDAETGQYLMIFPPAKNYDLVISSEDFLPQLLNVYIPYQTYFYELYQEIHLQPIELGNGIVGEVVTVNNTFYDLYKTAEADSIITEDSPKQPKYYDHLLELIENIIETTDTLQKIYTKKPIDKPDPAKNMDALLNMIEEAIETTDPVTLSILDANAKQKDKIKQTHFYTEGDKEKSLVTTVVGGDTIYTAPPIKTNIGQSNFEKISKIKKEAEVVKEAAFKTSSPEDRKYVHRLIIYYDIDKDEIPLDMTEKLNGICKLLVDNPLLGAEIYGFTDSQGAEKYNLSLSRQRAQKVLKYFLDQKVDYQKLIVKGYGETHDHIHSSDPKYLRKVEINVFELKGLEY